MSAYIRETPFGQIVRYLTGGKVFRYPEEEPGFKIPWLDPEVVEKAAEEEAQTQNGNEKALSPQSTADHTPSVNEKTDPMREPAEDPEKGLSTIPTQRSSARDLTRVATRTTTREQTRQYTQERFEVELQEAAERQQSSIIIPQKTADGITLIDWYETDDPANPQNWNSYYKAFVTFIIFLYTFGVYCASAIYTPAEPEFMRKFGVGQSKASLGLSMYVLGYGVGPMVSSGTPIHICLSSDMPQIFSPLSELPLIGRNPPYVATYALFVVLAVPTALSNSVASFYVLRFLTGFFGSPCLATGGATMGDLYGLLKLPYALVAWVAASFSAPALGPLLSGFAVMNEG
jgi:DHA1 family multidrug resistance protein-like MFS transporter